MIKDFLATEQRTAIERWCRDRARAVPMHSGTTLCRVLGELMMVVDLSDLSVAPHLALDGYWEIWLSMCLAKRLRPGWRSIDVGANFGYYTLLMAVITGAEVEAWEPMSDLAEMIETSACLSGVDKRVRVLRHAASDEIAAAAQMTRAQGNWGGASLQQRDGTLWHVTTQRIDSVERDHDPDFMKIDTEGHEPEVWRGMENILDRGKPLAILMEWSPKFYKDPKRFLADIKDRGFRVSVVDGAGELQAPVGDITEVEGHLDLWLQR